MLPSVPYFTINIYLAFLVLGMYACRMVLETDGNIIAGKVSSHNMDDGAPLSEQVSDIFFLLLNLTLIMCMYTYVESHIFPWLHINFRRNFMGYRTGKITGLKSRHRRVIHPSLAKVWKSSPSRSTMLLRLKLKGAKQIF